MKSLIAMSGGVDSSVAALIIKNKGIDCAGVTMRLNTSDGGDIFPSEDIADAKRIAESLGFEHFITDLSEPFREMVIGNFIAAYESGQTPNPCIVCNRTIKFGKLWDFAAENGFNKLVTGHYARIERDGDRFLLKKGIDEAKDQSYFLYSLTRTQLSNTEFPLGCLTKEEVREIAEKNGLINARKRDSQDICFISDGDYARFIIEYTGKEYPCGSFVDAGGNILGEHSGIIRYTIGQRKGLGVAFGKPMYVCDICPENNTVVLGDNADLFTSSLDAYGLNLTACDNITQSVRLKAKVRYNQREQQATVIQTGEDTIHVEFETPQRAVTKGQAVVLYDGDTVIGGAVIK